MMGTLLLGAAKALYLQQIDLRGAFRVHPARFPALA